ncbi:uncharacterized protein LOC113494670 [Trichoplusia ni]|uniref:Uncharacterized protein LOC113494670 n=1 Tax=Trichoplusia ni TaxID=7111 RepID=A0A7E5VKN0_TRINI|nr:uncharacterized protein LOC113494670 [Trichoplusia ni]XP_026728878.1 uncharacterized protein LOC113494670 [Trichoplusia ni]
MESHILNTYHQARFRPIGHKILRMKSDSLSSESSCTQNSPEYPQISVPQQRHAPSSHGQWGQEQTMNTTQSSQDTSSDDESSGLEESMEELDENEVQENGDDSGDELGDSIVVHEVDVGDDDDNIEGDDDNDVIHPNSVHNLHIGPNSVEDNTLVEGHDYDVITVYEVNPDLDLIEASSEDEREVDYVSEKDPTECVNGDDSPRYKDVSYQESSTLCQDGLDINLDTPVVSNVDEYFIKNNNHEHILDTDGPVVKDVDEYFIKDKGKETIPVPNVDDFFIKHKLPEEESTQFHLPVPTPKVEEFIVSDVKKDEEENLDNCETEPEQDNNADVSINESDLEVLPNIEDLKRYLLEDMTYTKFRHIQKSCSVPQSPMQNICMDIDDVKTCMSFEDLNLDLSDLAFDNDKDKSDSANKSDDMPRTLTDEDVNSFLITNKTETKVTHEEDDLSHQDMEIERPLEPIIETAPKIIEVPSRKRTSTPIPTVLEFCIEKTAVKKESTTDSKELEDFVDVESCHDAVIPVLEANNLNSLLEQFEATEKLNTKKKTIPVVKTEDPKMKSFNKNALTNGMRLQDAGVQLNKNKMRQILMPTPINTTIRRSQSPVHSDHDYCSSKKRHSLPNLKGGQSLLKPEVLSSNSRILNSRHRSCKSKKVVYALSSDEETDNNAKNKKVTKPDDVDAKKKASVKPSVKPPVQSNCRKKLSPPHSAPDSFKDKPNSSVMIKSASKASDNCSQNSNGSIKLTIKNKSEVILNCDHVDSQKDKNIDKCKNSVRDKTNNVEKQEKSKELDRNKAKVVNSVETVIVKEEPRPKNENFYTTLFSNKQDVQVPQAMQPKTEKRQFDEELNKCMLEAAIKKETEQPLKKKKLNLQEYKLRRGVCSNNSSATVSPEAIFPDMPSPLLDKAVKCPITQTPPNGLLNTANKVNNEQKFFDPIKEASRKILMNTKKQKAEATRKRDEDIVMSKIPKVENLQLQPLISDAEMMKIVGMTQPEVTPAPAVNEKPQLSADYQEIILVSIGTNTDDTMFKQYEEPIEKMKATSPTADSKNLINFKIKKSDHVLKQNVFDNVKRDKRSPVDDKRHADVKIDKERYKDITATLKSVEKQVETKISSNSLFASIQDVVMKKAPEDVETQDDRHFKLKSPVDKRVFRFVKTTIVREYDPKAEHGEDKVILHLGKHRSKPNASSIVIQTDSLPEYAELPVLPQAKEVVITRTRNDSDMSLSSDGSPSRKKDVRQTKPDERIVKPKEARPERTEAKEKRSRSKERYEPKYRRRSRSLSRGRRRRSRSRSRSRSRGRYRRYRRSDSPYKRKRRSRSPYHKRRSPSVRRERSIRSRSRSRPTDRSKSPVAKKSKPSPHSNGSDRKIAKSMTPPLRKPTVSESSDSSTSSSSSSSSSDSSSSGGSTQSRGSCSPYKRDDQYKKKYRSFSSEDRESNTPVEERRIVFVGRLDKDVNKITLRNQFCKFGPVLEVRLHSKEDGSRYGFVTYQRARDAWSAVEAANSFPQYDVGFGGRRAFCRQSYADLDGLEAKYTESAFHGQAAPPIRRDDDMSFEQMLLEMKKKLSQRKNEMKRPDDPKP